MSIVEVARVAGVSVSTVSRVINRNAGVSIDKVRKVNRAMGTVGYSPRIPEKRKGPKLTNRDTCNYGRVAVLFPASEVPFACNQAVRAITAIGNALRQRSYQADFLVIEEQNMSTFDESVYVGMIILGYNNAINLIEKQVSIPCVALSSNTTNSGVDCVLAGNFEIGEIAADYLVLKKECKKIAFLDFNPLHSGLRARGKGFIFRAEELGAQARWISVDGEGGGSDSPETFSDLERFSDLVLKKFLVYASEIDGIFIPLDRYTAFIYPKLINGGLKPGKDIFVISSDNEPSWLAGLSPRPATIDVNIDHISQKAAERLFQRIFHEDDSPAMRISFDPVLIEGEDVAK